MPSIPKSCSLTWYSSNTRKNASTVQSEETTYHFGAGPAGFRSRMTFASAGVPRKKTMVWPVKKTGPIRARLWMAPNVARRAISTANRPNTTYDAGVSRVIAQRNRATTLSNMSRYRAIKTNAPGIEAAIPKSSIRSTIAAFCPWLDRGAVIMFYNASAPEKTMLHLPPVVLSQRAGRTTPTRV
jgi:hypothetical protein